jgi:hypothetical protein
MYLSMVLKTRRADIQQLPLGFVLFCAHFCTVQSSI